MRSVVTVALTHVFYISGFLQYFLQYFLHYSGSCNKGLLHCFRFLYTVILHVVNYVLCVYHPVFGLVCCFLSSGCHTTPLIHCCSSIKITPKAVPLYLSTGALQEGIVIQSIVGGAQPAPSVILIRKGPSA